MTPISSILLPLKWTTYHRPRDWQSSTKQTEDRRLVWCEVAYVIDALGQGSDPQTRSTGGLEPNTNVRMSRLIVGTRPDTRMARGAARTSLVYCFFLEGIIQIAECRGPRSKKTSSQAHIAYYYMIAQVRCLAMFKFMHPHLAPKLASNRLTLVLRRPLICWIICSTTTFLFRPRLLGE